MVSCRLKKGLLLADETEEIALDRVLELWLPQMHVVVPQVESWAMPRIQVVHQPVLDALERRLVVVVDL